MRLWGKDRAYADKYRAEGPPIHLNSIVFSREQRTLVGFASERYHNPVLINT
ncbi:hypothetical protein [Halochromatium sp.]